jgi:hypothetical protein
MRLEAHSSAKLSWEGTYQTRTAVPDTCLTKSQGGSVTCDNSVIAPSGTYKLVVYGSTGWQCANGQDCGCENDSCFSQPYGTKMVRSGTLLEPSVTFDLGTTNTVTVAFTEGMENQ